MDIELNCNNIKGNEKIEKLTNIDFVIPREKLLDFTECITLLTAETGIVSFDMEDFEKALKNFNKVRFFAFSGSDILSVTNDFCNYISPDIIGGNALVVITSNSFSSENTQFIENSLESITHNLAPHDIYYSIYEREASTGYSLYIFCTVPN